MRHFKRIHAALGIVVVATLALTACSGASGGHTAPAESSQAANEETNGSPGPSAGNPDSDDCLLGANGTDVEVGIADPTTSCGKWIQDLAGTGLAWNLISQMVAPGSLGTADGETMQEACDLTDGTEELYVEDAGGQSYGDSICSQEEQNGWTPESSPGPLAVQAQEQVQAQASASAVASQASANADAEQQAQSDVNTLTQDTNLSSDVNTVAGEVQTTNTDLRTTRSDAANGNGYQCINASTTVYNDAATTVYNDVLTTIYNDANTVASDIATLRTDIKTVQSDQTSLRNANLPGTPGAFAAVSSAETTVASALSAVNTDIKQANSDLSTAYSIADSVGTGACAGDGPGKTPADLSPLH